MGTAIRLGAQEMRQIPWLTLVERLEGGLRPEAIRNLLRQVGRCAPGLPSVDEERRLRTALSQRREIDPGALIEEWACAPDPEVWPRYDEVDVSGGPRRESAYVQVTVTSDRAADVVRLDGQYRGVVPLELSVPSGRPVRINIGTGTEGVDTVVTPRAGWLVEIAKARSRVQVRGPDAPTRSVLESQMERLGRIQPIPEELPLPEEPKRPSAFKTFLLAAMFGGVAYLAPGTSCASVATSPFPDGGVFRGEYFPPGSVVPALQTTCSAAVGGMAFLGTAAIVAAVKRRGYQADTTRYGIRLAAVRDSNERRRELIRRRNDAIDVELARLKGLETRWEDRFNVRGAERPATFEVDPVEAFQGVDTRLTLRASLPARLVEWRSSNPTVASVDPDGIVHFRAQGSVKIFASRASTEVVRAFEVAPRLLMGASVSIPEIPIEGERVFAIGPARRFCVNVQGSAAGTPKLVLIRPDGVTDREATGFQSGGDFSWCGGGGVWKLWISNVGDRPLTRLKLDVQ